MLEDEFEKKIKILKKKKIKDQSEIYDGISMLIANKKFLYFSIC
jgi:mRNA-degrading endonuclease YafQ of YafQ-DinJ toxin-antitoxin module